MQTWRTFFMIVALTVISALIAAPIQWPTFYFFGRPVSFNFELKQGLDIQGGMQIVLQADMSQIEPEDHDRALESVREVMLRRVDMFGIAEPVVQTSQRGDDYRLIVELPGVEDPTQALRLIGTTAELDFRLFQPSEQATDSAEPATQSAETILSQFQETGLTGANLNSASMQFSQGGQGSVQGEPLVALEFDSDGTDIFRQVTTDHQGEMLAIFLDGIPIMTPVINDPILTGEAVITGSFSVEEARNLAIQLNAGALPVPIEVIEQRTVGASLGQASVEDSIRAGLIGLGLVMTFMILYYGFKGVLASLALVVYSVLTVAVYKVLGVTLTLPGIAGLLLSIGMAVDANILIFERMKEELRDGKPFQKALELGFGRAWDSIKDANLATILTALVLINPFNLSFLNSSGLVRGFGITLFIGVLISLFTGVVVTQTLMKLFLAGPKPANGKK